MLETGKNWVGEAGRCEPSVLVFSWFFFFSACGGGGRDGMRFHFPENRREFLLPLLSTCLPRKEELFHFSH